MGLFDSAGALLGQLGVKDDKPLDDAEKVVATLEIFAARAAAKIGIQRSVRKLQEEMERV